MFYLYKWFERRCCIYNSRLVEIYEERDDISPWRFKALSESLVSDAWQSWNLFSRCLILSSVRGCKAVDGSAVAALVRDDYSWKRICYEAKYHGTNNAKMLKKKEKHNGFLMRYEPTWGDTDFLIKAINGFKPNNEATLLAAIGSFTGLKMMQSVRNVCAHKNVEIISEFVSQYSTDYSFPKNADPVNFIWARKRFSNDMAIERWIYEMRMMARLSTSTR